MNVLVFFFFDQFINGKTGLEQISILSSWVGIEMKQFEDRAMVLVTWQCDFPWSLGVLVCTGCDNKIPQTAQLTESRMYFFLFWRLEVWDWGSAGSSEDPPPAVTSPWSSHGKSLFYRPSHLPKTPAPHAITLSIKISTYELGEDTKLSENSTWVGEGTA